MRTEYLTNLNKCFIIITLSVVINMFDLNHSEAKAMSHNHSAEIQVFKNGEFPSAKEAESYFTGNVRVDGLLPLGHPSNISAAYVTFESGARTAWHTHPEGQFLIVTSGVGQVQQWDGKIMKIKAGDTVWFPPHVKHWHGATTENAMTHISIVVMNNGNAADWMEKVSDEQYKK